MIHFLRLCLRKLLRSDLRLGTILIKFRRRSGFEFVGGIGNALCLCLILLHWSHEDKEGGLSVLDLRGTAQERSRALMRRYQPQGGDIGYE